MAPPKDFDRHLQQTREAVASIDGWLSDDEIKLLSHLAAYPTARGHVLEIGTFRGRSAIVLARAAQWADDGPIAAVDPLIACPQPAAGEQRTNRELLAANLQHAGVADYVEFHQMTSAALAARWQKPLRLLWIDGDHRYAPALSDITQFTPFLSDGAMVVFHDVINVQYPDVARVFAEEVLESPHYGQAGICDSIGWAQYFKDPATARSHHRANRRHARTLVACTRLMNPLDWPPRGWTKFRFRRLFKKLPRPWPDLPRPMRIAA